MTILEFNTDIASKTTFLIPILFGDLQYNKRELFSYSIFENNSVKEVRFFDKKVLKYSFDENKFLSNIDIYQPDNTSKNIKIELIEKSETQIKFRDWTPGNGDGNHGTLQVLNNGLESDLHFHRVKSFLGYNIKAHFKYNTSGMLMQENYYEWNSSKKNKILQKVLQNEYVMKNNELDILAREILLNGWSINDEILQRISVP